MVKSLPDPSPLGVQLVRSQGAQELPLFSPSVRRYFCGTGRKIGPLVEVEHRVSDCWLSGFRR